jgi:hypothetical protein
MFRSFTVEANSTALTVASAGSSSKLLVFT